MTNDLWWFPCNPSKMLATLSAMGADEQLIFITVVFRIYDMRGSINDDHLALGRRTGLTPKRARAALDRLFETGKLVTTEGAYYTNPEAQQEIETLCTKIKVQSELQSARAKKRWGRNQNPVENQRRGDAVGMPSQSRAMPDDADKKTQDKSLCAIPSSRKFADEGSPQYVAWDKYLKSIGLGGAGATDARPDGRIRRGWYFDSEWPPNHKPSAIAA